MFLCSERTVLNLDPPLCEWVTPFLINLTLRCRGSREGAVGGRCSRRLTRSSRTGQSSQGNSFGSWRVLLRSPPLPASPAGPLGASSPVLTFSEKRSVSVHVLKATYNREPPGRDGGASHRRLLTLCLLQATCLLCLQCQKRPCAPASSGCPDCRPPKRPGRFLRLVPWLLLQDSKVCPGPFQLLS